MKVASEELKRVWERQRELAAKESEIAKERRALKKKLEELFDSRCKAMALAEDRMLEKKEISVKEKVVPAYSYSVFKEVPIIRV